MERHAYMDHVNTFSITRASYVCVSREKINHILEKFLNFWIFLEYIEKFGIIFFLSLFFFI